MYCRWLKAWGMQISSETQLRKLSKEQTGTNLSGETAPFAFGLKNGIDYRPAPLVFTPDLISQVLQLVKQNDRYQTSTLYIECHQLSGLS